MIIESKSAILIKHVCTYKEYDCGILVGYVMSEFAVQSN